MYLQTHHDSLTGVGQRSSSRPSGRTQSAPSLQRPILVYHGNSLGSIEEEPSRPSSPPTQFLPTPAIRLKNAVAKLYRPVDWRKLPRPVFECILDQLRTSDQETSCSTCFMRDVCAVQLTCKAWFSQAQQRLYSSISLEGDDSPEQLKRSKVKYGARLMLLRRTLRAKSLLANLVQHLRVPDPIIPLYRPNGDPNPNYDEYLCLLASIVMACPNLEVFDGFLPFYNHTFDRLTHALSTREKLKRHVWIIAENIDCSNRAQKQLPPGIMDPHQTYQFLQYHDRWSHLETLLLCSPGSLGVLEHHVFIVMLHSLPKLKHLCVSSFDADDFHDGTLLALPPLTSLRLEECPGVTDTGLIRWSSSPNTLLMENLSLIHMTVVNLLTIARLMAGLERLKKFTLLQSDVLPSLPVDTVVFQPLFASQTIEFLHWDVASAGGVEHVNRSSFYPGEEEISANTYLALSLLHHGFPSLTKLRAPRDTSPPGMLQSVCRPARNMRTVLAQDSYANPSHKSRAWGSGNNLQAARLRAQKVINQAISKCGEGCKVVVTDHSYVRTGAVADTTLNRSTSESSVESMATISTMSTDVTDPSVGCSADERAELRDRYIKGCDWDKEVVQASARYETSSTSVQGPLPSSRSSSVLPSSEFNSTAISQLIAGAVKIREFSLPTFTGRVNVHISPSGQIYTPPRLWLHPDMPGKEGNGGIIGWGDLLQVQRRAATVGVQSSGEKGPYCDGRRYARVADSKKTGPLLSRIKSAEKRWKHHKREIQEIGRVDVRLFF